MKTMAARVWIAGLWLSCSTLLPAQTVSITEYPVPTSTSEPGPITAGPDGALWFLETNNEFGYRVGRITTSGIITEYMAGVPSLDGNGIITGPDGALWFTTNNSLGRITTSGAFTSFPLTQTAELGNLTVGPDGALWFPSAAGGTGNIGYIGRMTTAGTVTTYTVPAGSSAPYSIAAGSDGNLWYTKNAGRVVGKVTPSGVFTEYPVPENAATTFGGITAGPDGALWFTTFNATTIGRITTAGVITQFPVGPQQPTAITSGPDGALWFLHGNSIGRITTAGVETDYPVPTGGPGLEGIAAGPDGAIWFSEGQGEKIGRLALVQTDAFFTGQQSLSGTIDYLQFQDGIPFGYYGFLQGSASSPDAWLYHFDLGYEYVTPGSTAGSIYFYDLASGHWWYSSSSLFPYLYDFTLNAWLYYFPNTQSPGHYTTNPRSFSNLTTGKIFTM